MRLKRLEVFGFKSFFDKTVITFQKGITGIVGPNGCGKSNFADAILWVLGEQSPKSLRGERMEDVIFSGTDQRKALSVAEVSLTIGEIANELPPPYTPYAELTLSRRLYRSGESEYLINKSPCRLKDIRDLLIDIGAGYHAHTIIEQGKVDDIITASPMQRREIVEEAAGIAKYRLRKAEALRKLDATERNLTRVTDIIGEIKRQRSALDRQAKKAEKVQEMSVMLKTFDLKIARDEWSGWKSEQEALEAAEADLKRQSEVYSGQLGMLDAAQAENKLLMTEKEQGLSERARDLSDVEKNIQRWEGKLETLSVQRQEWLAAQSRMHEEIEGLKNTLSSLETEGISLDEEAILIAKTLPEAEATLAEHDRQARQLNDEVLDVSTHLESCKVSLFDLSAQVTTSKNNLAHFEARLAGLLKQEERLGLEQETLEEKFAESEAALKVLKVAEQKNIALLETLKTQRGHTILKLETTETNLQKKAEQLLSVKEASVDVKARVASHEGFYRGFLNKREGTDNPLLTLEGLKGMVADLIEVPPVYELALE
ncbi:MAG: AAA family ATPase, partial [Nitrospirota bacterium]|nr:AAA family ATPase [Nitrospirota bacterium]